MRASGNQGSTIGLSDDAAAEGPLPFPFVLEDIVAVEEGALVDIAAEADDTP